jgi:FlgD Ig-like domain
LAKWILIPSFVDSASQTVTALIDEGGVFTVGFGDIQTDIVDGDNDHPALPSHFVLSQNYPNPFNPSTIISHGLPVKAEVTIAIYNVLGQKVKVFVQGQQSAGEYSVTWDATDDIGKEVASGMYLYKVTAGDFSASRKMVLLK